MDNQQIGERPSVSIREACEIAGVSRRTIYHWLRDGKVEFTRTAGGSVRIFTDTLMLSGPTRNWSSLKKKANPFDRTAE